MAGTQVRGTQITDGTITRTDVAITPAGSALIRRILEGNGITFTSSTGADSGTGDVTIAANTTYLNTLYSQVGHTHTLGNLSNVNDITDTVGSLTIGDLLQWTGSEWNKWTPNYATSSQIHYVGTTAIAANRASLAQTLTGVSIDGNSATTTLAANSSLLNGISNTQIFNNMGQNHGTWGTGFNQPTDFGPRFIQGTTDGPSWNSSQSYSLSLGLGNDYAYSAYAMQIQIPRNVTTPYMGIRYRENGTWGAWTKLKAGEADNATTVTSITSGQVTTALGYTPYNSTNPNGYTSNTGTVTSVSGAGTVNGLTLTGTVTTTGSLTLGGTLAIAASQVTSGAFDSARLATGTATAGYVIKMVGTTPTWQPDIDTDSNTFVTSLAFSTPASAQRTLTLTRNDAQTVVGSFTLASADITTALGFTPYNSTNPSGYITSAALASYQPLDADLTSIAGLTGTTGLLRKTAADTWSLDTATYATQSFVTSQGYITDGNTNWDNSYGFITASSTETLTNKTWNGAAIADAYISSAATWNAKQAALGAGTAGQYLGNGQVWRQIAYSEISGTPSLGTYATSASVGGNIIPKYNGTGRDLTGSLFVDNGADGFYNTARIVTTTNSGGSRDFDTRGDARWSLLGHTHTDYAASSHTHTFASLTSKPTTIGGYGITDFNSLGDARWSLTSHTHNYIPRTGDSGLTGNYTTTGNMYAAAFFQNSDRSLKTEITPLTYGLEEILQLKPSEYKFKTDLTQNRLGLIVDEVEDIIPEIVSYEEGVGRLAYAELVPVLIKAIQELTKRITQLENGSSN